MSKETKQLSLAEFLMENPVDDMVKDVIISKRLEEYPFKIKAMSGSQMDEVQKRTTAISKTKGVDFDTAKFNELVIKKQTVSPDLNSVEFLTSVKCKTPEEFIENRLTAGEVAKLAEEILKLSGFNEDLDSLVGEVKNA